MYAHRTHTDTHTPAHTQTHIYMHTHKQNNMQHIEDNREQHTYTSTQDNREQHTCSAHNYRTYSLDYYFEFAYIKNSNTIELYTILQDKI